MKSQDAIEQQYREAVDSLVEKVKQDPYILAAIVAGSFSYAQVWQKSDLDVELIGRDDIRPNQSFYILVENGINIHASLTPRSHFKKTIERAQQGSITHSYFSHSTLLFSRDDSIKQWYDKNANRHNIGERDRQVQLLNVAASILPNLIYAEKQFYVNNDIITCFLTLLNVVQGLARIEVLLNDEVPAREVIQPALHYNPDFFNHVYTELINCQKNETVIQHALDAINAYLDERQFIFKPILDYLTEQKTPRSNTELNAYFRANFDEESLSLVCQWLAWKGRIQQVAVPMKLTRKSQGSVEEPAYYYDENNEHEDDPGQTDAAASSPPKETPTRYPQHISTKNHIIAHADKKQQIHDALDRLIQTLKQDRYVLAAVLTSNLAENNVWEKTTPFITLILRDGTKFKQAEHQLIEENVPIRVKLHTRSAYRQLLEKTLQGSTLHAMLAQSEILFSKEPGLADWLQHITDNQLGERDKHAQLLNNAADATAVLAKAEKWFYLKRDLNYTFLYLIFVIRQLAAIECLMHGETPKRKVIYQAIKHNPAFFNTVFTQMLHIPKDQDTLQHVLEQVDAYLADNVHTLFKPLLDFLQTAREERTITDLYDHFGQRNLLFEMACEWLAQKDVIEQFAAPIRLTKDSQVSLEQPSYYYDADNPFL